MLSANFKPKRIAAASRGFLATAQLFLNTLLPPHVRKTPLKHPDTHLCDDIYTVVDRGYAVELINVCDV